MRTEYDHISVSPLWRLIYRPVAVPAPRSDWPTSLGLPVRWTEVSGRSRAVWESLCPWWTAPLPAATASARPSHPRLSPVTRNERGSEGQSRGSVGAHMKISFQLQNIQLPIIIKRQRATNDVPVWWEAAIIRVKVAICSDAVRLPFIWKSHLLGSVFWRAGPFRCALRGGELLTQSLHCPLGHICSLPSNTQSLSNSLLTSCVSVTPKSVC